MLSPLGLSQEQGRIRRAPCDNVGLGAADVNGGVCRASPGGDRRGSVHSLRSRRSRRSLGGDRIAGVGGCRRRYRRRAVSYL